MLSKVERIDKFGHCCYCSEYLLVKCIVDGKVIEMFKPTYDDTMFLLNDGSQMQITICKKCKESIDLENENIHSEIMDAVYKGWELETAKLVNDENYPNYTEDIRTKDLSIMLSKTINCNSENLDKFTIQNKVVEIRNLKIEEIKEEVSIVSD